MKEKPYRLVRDNLGFYSQVPIEELVQVEQPAPIQEEDDSLASLGGVQIVQEPQEPKRKRRGRPRREEAE